MKSSAEASSEARTPSALTDTLSNHKCHCATVDMGRTLRGKWSNQRRRYSERLADTARQQGPSLATAGRAQSDLQAFGDHFVLHLYIFILYSFCVQSVSVAQRGGCFELLTCLASRGSCLITFVDGNIRQLSGLAISEESIRQCLNAWMRISQQSPRLCSLMISDPGASGELRRRLKQSQGSQANPTEAVPAPRHV